MRGSCFKSFIIFSTIVISILIFITPLEAKEPYIPNLLLVDYDTPTNHPTPEKGYLKERGYVNVCINRNNLPFEALKEGRIEGMISDLIEHFSSTTNAKFNFVEMSYPYEAKRLVEEKKCDIVPFVAKNPETESYLTFTKPLLNTHSVYITRDTHSFIASVNDIKKKKIALVKGTPLGEFFLQNFPKLDFMLVDSNEEAFKAVADSRADVCVDFLASADERIKNLALYDLKFSGNTPFQKPLRLGIRSDDSELISVVDKSLAMLSDAELNDMMEKWVSVKFEYRFDYKLFWEMAFIIAIIIAVGIFYNYKIMTFNREIRKKNRELNTQKDLVVEKNRALIEINKQISDSINYATYIQRSFLPSLEMMKNDFSDMFVLWEPRDKVGGDIYFYDSTRDGFILAVIDCTGHGVPGGFITMIVGTALKRVKDEDSIYHTPSELLRYLNINIKLQLNQNKPETLSDDGVDIGLCYIDRASKNMTFSGAKISLYYIEDRKINIIKGDKESIGYKKSKIDYEYQEYHLPYKKGRTFYLFSDGILDQGGGAKGFPFGNKRIKELLLELEEYEFEARGEKILEVVKNYQGEAGTRDDMTVIGFKID